MPTAPKVVAAAIFGSLGYAIIYLVIPLLPEGMSYGYLREITAGSGVIAGWTMSGAKAGDGTRAGIGLGLTSVALLVFYSNFSVAFLIMLGKAIDKRYAKGPMQAIKDMVKMFVENLGTIASPAVIISLLIGAVVGGILVERAAERWS
ncbi:MAG: TrgA family protein [Paracoccaceae bacterium]|nr:TrgA family protein [Paracoccaceae bacterium]